MMDITTRESMLNAFEDADIAQPTKAAPLVPIGKETQLEQRPVGAVKVAVVRDEKKILQRLRVFAAAAGEDFYYRFPVKVKVETPNGIEWGQDWIEGPSIKCAMAVARAYGNCEIDVRTQDVGDAWIIYARFVDYESGFSVTRAFQQRKGQKSLKTDNARALDIVFQIGQSKAIRNVVCNAIGMFTDFAFEEAKAAIVARVGKNLDQYRAKVLARLAELKIETKRVELVVGRPADKWLAPDIARIIAEIQAINDGMAAADDLYPPIGGTAPPPKQPERADFDEEVEVGDNGETDKVKPAADQWPAYIEKMAPEFLSAKKAKDQAIVNATFQDTLNGAVDRGEITEARAREIMDAWSVRTGQKK